ncbi:MAG: hypothetical protein GKS03_01505 [Alphaproteobacteria bacterium]|nr:hypothetical protein [Alphaproteobacteria bacterium]
MWKRCFTVLCVTFGLSGCAAYVLVEPDQPAAIGAELVVDPQVSWARVAYPTTNGSLWTIDGLGLNQLYFFTEVEAGKPMVRIQGQAKDAMPFYEESMIATDVMELVETTLTRLGNQQVEATNLRPAKFGPRNGFQFDLTMTSQGGLIVKGLCIAAQRDDELDALLFLAAEEYYYELHRPVVEKVFASIRPE